MSASSKIEWTDATWNPVRGCTRVSEGCRNCYAEVMAARFSAPGQWGHGFAEMRGGDHRWTGRVELIDSQLDLPMRWRKPRRIFVNSTSDLFHENLPDAAIDRVFAAMALSPQHTFMILTKRPKRMRKWFSRSREGRACSIRDTGEPNPRSRADFCLGDWPLKHVWIGVSIEDQETADDRIPVLLETPAAVRFVSAEPLLGPVKFLEVLDDDWLVSGKSGNRRGLDWVIAGGESGKGSRPTHPDWFRSIRDQCQTAKVPFFFKQWGGRTPKAGGRVLDGHEWNEFP